MNSLVVPKNPTSVREKSTDTLPAAFRLFTKGWSPRILAVKTLIFCAVRPFVGPFGIADLFIFCGVFLWWPLQEWIVHLAILHKKPVKIAGFTFDSLAAKIHRYHHAHPWTLETIFVPWPVIVMLAPFHILIWWLIMPNPGLACTGIVAYTFASLLYEWVHFFAHITYSPSSAWLREIQKNHRAHHFKNENYWHAFTVPAVDRLFGTGPSPRDVPKSKTCRTLGVE